MEKILLVSNKDNVAIGFQDLPFKSILSINGHNIEAQENIPAKHKISLVDLKSFNKIFMYCMDVDQARLPIPKGSLLTTENVMHSAGNYSIPELPISDNQFEEKQKVTDKVFEGYLREDVQVGTANYWIFIPLVFCQNRNISILKDAFEAALGYKKENPYKLQLMNLIYGDNGIEVLGQEYSFVEPLFQNIDGLKFLAHEGGCGGTREYSKLLVKLLSGYIKNPNVAGATILSLGCQHAQFRLLEEELNLKNNSKKILFFEQQQFETENKMLSEAVLETFQELKKVNNVHRVKAPLSKLSIGMECGGSDGFSGIPANLLMGIVADKVTALGGKIILSEFPELCGVEQNIINRCANNPVAEKFVRLMENYNNRAKATGSGFDMNPSPGNINYGLITDAIKSAGAATKGGKGQVNDVLDYGEYAVTPGLNLLCTPGNDVESTPGLAGAGANIILFSTGLGTPTGNPVCPVIKISSNSKLKNKMTDIIDFDAGRIISEGADPYKLADELLELVIKVASGTRKPVPEFCNRMILYPGKEGFLYKIFMKQIFNLEGKTAIVTGGASGIGKAISEKFIEHGGFVIILEYDDSKIANFHEEHRSGYEF
ncbi:UxaA family hydrolase [Autumnicola musiva]|uniref:SDR family NAD(P)-dependent oxidoreductase n=1 Tax=Autumnicola musiva TaxID=3075589 RepID=A0ABU3D2U9_9FLAO|nr:SDR family NAD(P)-dependent oxidoreductase [Zunongwangia sp. F117]MDT0675866.1 SDR family NAD(P)-dependent oxidoreductase [Zunongwangia sp. F117]